MADPHQRLHIQLIYLAIVVCFLPLVTSQFNTLVYSIEEEKEANTFIGNVVKDVSMPQSHVAALSSLRYSFLPQGDSRESLFSLDERTGNLSTATIIDRDVICAYKVNCTITLKIKVSPDSYFAIIRVDVHIIDINDIAPAFQELDVTVDVMESARPGDILPAIPVADDQDSPRFGITQYGILQGEDADFFRLKSSTVVKGAENIYLELRKSLDHEKQTEYHVTIVAYDGGTPPLSGSIMVHIQVRDVNDNNPRFSNETYHVTVEENIEQYTEIVQVHATDPDKDDNGEVTYGFSDKTQADNGGLFMINTDTGQVYVIGDLDYELGSSYILTITAQDKNPNSVPARAKLYIQVVDLNDNAPNIRMNTDPAFDGHLKVSEYAGNGTFLAFFTVTDQDSGRAGQFTCSLNDNHFLLQRLGETDYKLMTNTRFDHETSSSYEINMNCKDQGTVPLTAIRKLVIDVVDENDHQPTFTKANYTAKVLENAEVGQVLLTVRAMDSDSGDNGRVHYFIADEDRDAEETFNLDPVSGNLTARKSFDREDKDHYNFTILAYDHGKPQLQSTAKVFIDIMDVDDQVPVFNQSIYEIHVQENRERNTIIGNVFAEDKDTSAFNAFMYVIEPAGLEEGLFNVADNGDVITNVVFDREMRSNYSFVVYAISLRDSRHRGEATVIVIIDDVNDNAPVITYPNSSNNTIYLDIENARDFPFAITHILCHDPDLGRNAELSYALIYTRDSMFFSLHPRTGVISINETVPVSEDGVLYSLNIIVTDNGTPSLSSEGTLYISIETETAGAFTETASKIHLGIVIGIVLASLLIITVLIVLIVITRKRIKKEQKLKWMAAMLDPKLRPLQQQAQTISSDVDQKQEIWPPPDLRYFSKEDQDILRKMDLQSQAYIGPLEDSRGRTRGSIASDLSSTKGSTNQMLDLAHQRASLASIASSNHSLASGASNTSHQRTERGLPKGLDVLEGTPVVARVHESPKNHHSMGQQGPHIDSKSKHKIIIQPEHVIKKPAVFNPNPHPVMEREFSFSGTDSGRGSTVSDPHTSTPLSTPLSTQWERVSLEDVDGASCDMLYDPDNMDTIHTNDIPAGIHRSCLRNSDRQMPAGTNSEQMGQALHVFGPSNHVRFKLPVEHGSLRSLDTSTISSMSTMSTLSSYGGALI